MKVLLLKTQKTNTFLSLGIISITILTMLTGCNKHQDYKVISYNSVCNAYTIYTPNTEWDNMKEYASLKKGNVTVLFFNDINNTPQLNNNCMDFDVKYDKNLIAIFDRDKKGKEIFKILERDNYNENKKNY